MAALGADSREGADMDTERIHRYGRNHQKKWAETLADLTERSLIGDASDIQRYAIQLANEKTQVGCYAAFLENQKRFGDDRKALAVAVSQVLDSLLWGRGRSDDAVESAVRRGYTEFISEFRWDDECSLADLLNTADAVADDIRAEEKTKAEDEQRKHDLEFGSRINPKTGKKLSWQSVRGAIVKLGEKNPNVKGQSWGEDVGKVIVRLQGQVTDTVRVSDEKLTQMGYHPEDPKAYIPYNVKYESVENPELMEQFGARVLVVASGLADAGFVFTTQKDIPHGWATIKVSGYKVEEG